MDSSKADCEEKKSKRRVGDSIVVRRRRTATMAQVEMNVTLTQCFRESIQPTCRTLGNPHESIVARSIHTQKQVCRERMKNDLQIRASCEASITHQRISVNEYADNAGLVHCDAQRDPLTRVTDDPCRIGSS